MTSSAEGGQQREYLKSLLAGSSVVFIGFVVENVISFSAQIAMARLLGRTGFGAVSIGITLAGMLGTLSLLGVHGGVGRFLPRANNTSERKGVILSAAHWTIPSSLITGGGMVVAAELLAQSVFGDASLIPIIRAFGVAIPFIMLIKFTVGVIQGMEQTRPKVYIQNIARPITRFSLVIAVLWAGFGTIGVSNAIVIAYVLTALMAALYLGYETDLLSKESATYIHRRIIDYSIPLAVTSSMIIIMSNVDTLFLGSLATTGDVGVYRVVYSMTSLLLLFLHSFKFVSMPMLSRADAENNSEMFNNIYRQMTRWILIVSFPAFAVLLLYSEQLIGGIYGVEYIPGSAVVPVLAAGFFLHAVFGPANSALKAIGRTKLIMYINLASALLNIGLNYILILRLGILGAAIATAVSYAFMNMLYIGSLLAENITIFDRRIFSVIAVAIVSFSAAHALSLWTPDSTELLSLLVLGILYTIGIGIFVISKTELRELETIVREKL